jgi:hypothetical protein
MVPLSSFDPLYSTRVYVEIHLSLSMVTLYLDPYYESVLVEAKESHIEKGSGI